MSDGPATPLKVPAAERSLETPMEKDSKISGKTDEIKGKAKQAWGDVTDDPQKALEGKREEKLGEQEQAAADLEKERRRQV